MDANSYDVAILGGGTGGYVAAIRAAQLGLRPVVIERDKLGGTCLHRGCIPTKSLLHSAALVEEVRHGAEFGVLADNPRIDFPKVNARKEKVVNQLHRGVEFLMKKNGVTVLKGDGRLVGPTELAVRRADGAEQRISARDVIIATGSAPRALPNLPFDGERIISSDHALQLTEIPGRVIILGAGAVGVEFGCAWNAFGSEVTIVEVLPTLVPLEDREVGQTLERIFKRRGITCLPGTRLDIASVRASGSGVSVELEQNGQRRQIEADMLLVAVGRAPTVQGIGLEELGVQLERGAIKVDADMRTNVPHVWAIGDVIGGLLLAHVAAHEGIHAVETIAGHETVPLDYNRMPRATYTFPEIASIGWTEDEARQHGVNPKVGKFPFSANSKAMITGETDGFAKIVTDAESGAIVGAHLIGPHATDLIVEPALAKLLEGTAWEIGINVHAHPTVSEILGEAALAVDGQAIHI